MRYILLRNRTLRFLSWKTVSLLQVDTSRLCLTILCSLLLFSKVDGQNSLDSLYHVLSLDIENEEAYKAAHKLFTQMTYADPAELQRQSKKIAELFKGKNELKWAMSLRMYAMSYYVLEEYDKALDILIPLIDIVKETGTKSDLALIYSSLSLAYRLRGELETVEKYSKDAIELFRADGNESMAASIANNLAMHYMEKDEHDKAEIFYNQAISYFRSNNLEQYLAYALLNRGSSYVLQNKNEKGITDITESLAFFEKTNNKLANSMAYTSLGNAYLNLSQLEKSESLLNMGYAYAKETKHTQQISIAAELLSRLHAQKEDYKSAYTFQKEWHILQDSFKSAEQDQHLVDALKKYESEKKEQEITILSNKNKIANQNSVIALSGVAGLSLFTILMYRNRNKVHAMNKILEAQKAEISKNLGEKEFLLKEIHHRVKNNLQVISSLLKLQSKSMTDSRAKQALDDGRVRVRSMALIHQNLYQKNNLSGIKMDDYIFQLTHELIETYQVNGHKINTEIDVEPIILDVESVVPIGLIINELVSNAIKYAFDNTHNGLLKVKLKTDVHQLILEIRDNGIGYEQAEITKDNFGLSLVEAFAHRLEAKYTIENDSGTRALFYISNFKLAV